MNSIFDLCQPRAEVLTGELREDIFAARLRDVIEGHAEPVYGNAETFFDNTWPTAGLKTLLNEALGRMVGQAAGRNAVIRLETAFGGGKTHNLIALYHVARGSAPANKVAPLLSAGTPLPAPGQIRRIAGVVGSDLDPVLGLDHPADGVRTYTLWGEMAYQLGGKAGYELAKQSDIGKVAPGTGLFEALVGDEPALIMLDEISRHLRSARAVEAGTKATNLAEQTVAFLMSLLEFAASKERCVVVLTLASESDAFGAETASLRHSLAEALKISARQERVLTPTVENEIPAIVTHRLFKTIQREEAKPVFDAYARYYGLLNEKNVDIPQRSVRSEYYQEFADSYPFHPELLATLNHKTATIPNFNQTRGALRLLAWTVRTLWEQRPENTWLIHLHHIDLANPQIAEDLTGRLDRPKFKQVIEADITSGLPGTLGHAQEIDHPLLATGKPPYATRLATTIFVHSLTQGIASGVDPSDLMLATLMPHGPDGAGDDTGVVQRTLENLYKKAWFLEYDGHRYRFKTEPSLNKIVEDETTLVGRTKAVLEVEGRVRQIWRKGFLLPAYFPSEPVEVDDDAGQPKLAIMHFDAVRVNAAVAAPPDLVRRIYDYSGLAESFRRYQNNVVFLVADEDQVDNMIGVARRYLALGRIVSDSSRMVEFNKEQRDELKKMHEAAELDVRVAITKAYRHLYYPALTAPKASGYLQREMLPAQEQGDVEKDQTNVIVRVLRSLGEALTADDEPLSAMYVKAKAWDQNQVSMTTEELRKAFARKVGLRFLLDVNQLRKTIQNGVKTRTWIYYDAKEEFGYDEDSPPAAWQISDDAILFTPQEAARLDVRIKGKWKPPEGGGEGLVLPPEVCPVCGEPVGQCICGLGQGEGKPTLLQAEGAVGQAFQNIVDQCDEHGISRLSRLSISIDGGTKQTASDIRSLGLALPQFGKAQFRIQQDLVLSFGTGGADSFTLGFRGGWDRYKRIKQLTDALCQEADELHATLRVNIAMEGGLEVKGQDLLSMREILETLGIGKTRIEAIPGLDGGTP